MAPGDSPTDRTEPALETVESWVEDARCPGASVAVLDGSETLAATGFGQRRRDPAAPATADTLYAVGSIAKPVTALATLLLVERDALALDHPVSEYVPYFEDAPANPVTVGQLLSHTSGMPNDDLAFVAGDLDGWEGFRAFVAETTDRRRTTGDPFYYYNSGYAVLDRVVTAASGTEFSAFVDREVFAPLGMDRATYDRSVLTDPDADAMSPFTVEDGDVVGASTADNPITSTELLRGPGGLVASVHDLGRFLRAHIDPEESPFDQSTVDRMRDRVATRERYVDASTTAYGYGWEIEPFGSDTLVGHHGNTGFSGGYVGFLADAGVGVALAHTGPADPKSPVRAALAALTDRDPDAVGPGAAVDRRLSALTGRYESPSGNHEATVRRTDARLDLSFGGDADAFEVRALPLDLSGSRYRFTDVDHPETTTDVELFDRDPPELVFEGMLFRRVDAVADDEAEPTADEA